MSEPEELKLVESFDELRAGDLVVITHPCNRCKQGPTRGIILGPRLIFGVPSFEVLPGHPQCGGISGFTARAVIAKVVFRIVSPAADEQTTATSSPTTRKRERVTSR